ncbi:LysR substrate-binding domain-containing protein [Cohnella terricola]|uniref:LysR family transcriptional regulator n=1 Tax=Cohnella terricola TaxID=1289167 RepID=A0A559JU09_9BACL|nr:LysR substrate-binding domain-containing protein [Cohnella terricola]TVY03361.1 LysR family transcriptional regulator [Cohnella terricola]
MNLSLLKLRIVELLEKYNKITAVAEILDLKQPTVTFHMKNLERDFGVKLFEARMGKIILTDAGHALHHYAVKIGALAAEAHRIVTEFDSLRQGSLLIGASYVPATYILPSVLHRFSKEYPGIQISLSVKTAPVVKDMLEHHEIDLGVISAEPFLSPELNTETIGEDDLVLICAPSHPLVASPEEDLTPELIASSSFVLHGEESSTRRLTEKWLQSSGVHLPTYLEFDSLEAIKQAVMLGEHVSFVSRMAVQSEVTRGLLLMRPIPGNRVERYVYALTNNKRYHSALIKRFNEYLGQNVNGSQNNSACKLNSK